MKKFAEVAKPSLLLLQIQVKKLSQSNGTRISIASRFLLTFLLLLKKGIVIFLVAEGMLHHLSYCQNLFKGSHFLLAGLHISSATPFLPPLLTLQSLRTSPGTNIHLQYAIESTWHSTMNHKAWVSAQSDIFLPCLFRNLLETSRWQKKLKFYWMDISMTTYSLRNGPLHLSM